jgi:class 3 adenylate cyclase/ABC-type glycerol-3-phosphate transport system substrate-binding protein
MADLPTGTVTFLFTDIEGSTRLLKQLGHRYGDVLTEHQGILRASFAAHGGREVDTQGDSFFAAFARAGDAVACAIDAQRALEAHNWPEDARVRVRMGLHSGEPRASGERYVGFGVHRAARIGAVAHGGQILLSNATRELVEDDLPPQTHLRDLGTYELKDLERPERLFQAEAEELQHEFPPPKARRLDRPRRRRRVALLAALLVAAVGAAVGIWRATSAASPVGTLAHPITIYVPWFEGDPEHQAFIEVLRAFEQTTGLQTKTLEVNDVSAGERPMLGFLSPSVLAERVRDGSLKPLASLGLTDEVLEDALGKSWVDLGRVDDKPYGLPLAATSKSLIWFRPRDFRRSEVRVPETWSGLLATTRRLERMGHAPWAVGAKDAFTLTDWFENVYIRVEGQWKYDALFLGKLPFDDSSVIAALKRMTMLLSGQFLAGGIDGALESSFPDAVGAVFGPDPSADLLMEGGFVGSLALATLKPTPKPGTTIAAMPFPPIEARLGNPVVVGADFIAASSDHDEVRRLLRYLISPGAGRIWVSTGTVVSPNKLVPLSAYPNDLVRTAAKQITSSPVVRFDGSDLLPGELGDRLGRTLQQVLINPAAAPRLMGDFQRAAARVFNG